MRESLNADRIQSLQGIVNGTTNYILSRMAVEGLSFSAALKEAQAKGYAEADPGNDVQGVDAMYKLAILIAMGFGTPVDVSALAHQGIDRLQATDIQYARDLGYVVKLIAEARDDGTIHAGVEPCLVPQGHPLAAVMSNFNAVLVRGEWAGDLMFYGQGAGAHPTATAVVSDIMQVCQAIAEGNRVVWPGGYWKQAPRPVRPLAEHKNRYYLRLQVADKPGVLASVAHIFGEEGVSFQSVLQKSHGEDPVDVVFMTHEASGKAIEEATRKLSHHGTVAAIYRVI
jgi:homoserine dehydrogenase